MAPRRLFKPYDLPCHVDGGMTGTPAGTPLPRGAAPQSLYSYHTETQLKNMKSGMRPRGGFLDLSASAVRAVRGWFDFADLSDHKFVFANGPPKLLASLSSTTAATVTETSAAKRAVLPPDHDWREIAKKIYGNRLAPQTAALAQNSTRARSTKRNSATTDAEISTLSPVASAGDPDCDLSVALQGIDSLMQPCPQDPNTVLSLPAPSIFDIPCDNPFMIPTFVLLALSVMIGVICALGRIYISAQENREERENSDTIATPTTEFTPPTAPAAAAAPTPPPAAAATKSGRSARTRTRTRTRIGKRHGGGHGNSNNNNVIDGDSAGVVQKTRIYWDENSDALWGVTETFGVVSDRSPREVATAAFGDFGGAGSGVAVGASDSSVVGLETVVVLGVPIDEDGQALGGDDGGEVFFMAGRS